MDEASKSTGWERPSGSGTQNATENVSNQSATRDEPLNEGKRAARPRTGSLTVVSPSGNEGRAKIEDEEGGPREEERKEIQTKMISWTRKIKEWFKNQRFPVLGSHHILIVLLLVATTLLGFVLGGCSPNLASLRHFFILSATYHPFAVEADEVRNSSQAEFLTYVRNITQQARLEVRVGFFGVCVHISQAVESAANWECGTLSQMSAKYSTGHNAIDPLGLVQYMTSFSSEVEFYGLFIASMILAMPSVCLLLTFPTWHTATTDDGSEHEVKPFPSRAVTHLLVVTLCSASFFVLVSMVWSQVAAVTAGGTLDFVFQGLVATNVGWLIPLFGWLAFSLITTGFMAMVVMVLSIQLLDMLTDEE